MRILATMIACTLLCTGCATVVRGTTQSWTVQTEPVGATVHLSTGEQCTTPCTLQKRRKDPFQVTITKDGYDQVVTDVVTTVNGAGAAGMAGNVLIGGLIGIGVDAATGATKDLVPNPLVVKMAATGSGQTPTINTPPPEASASNSNSNGDGRAARLANYGEAAKQELAKRQCTDSFQFVRFADGQEQYQATCGDKHVQSVQCDGVACRPTK